jgi:LacI family transcriptional regulator
MKRAQQAQPHITINDVAQVAAVSPTTVSNVLNGRTNAMSPETWQRVQTAIRQLRYRPSHAARGLVTHRSATIGLIIAEIETPLFLQALHHIEPIARTAGYNVLLCIARNLADERQALDLLLEKQVEGIIFLSTSQSLDDNHLLELKNTGLPVVLVNRAMAHDCFDQINWDNSRGIGKAVDHLVELGHRDIALLRGPDKRRSSGERLSGYRLALERHGIAFREEFVQPGDFTALADQWRQSTLNLLALNPRPTALIASDDVVAAIVMSTLERAGLHIPNDLSVVGFDDQSICTLLNPTLSTVQLPIIEAGKLAGEMLLQRIAGERGNVQHITLQCQLIRRDSTGVCAQPAQARFTALAGAVQSTQVPKLESANVNHPSL